MVNVSVVAAYEYHPSANLATLVRLRTASVTLHILPKLFAPEILTIDQCTIRPLFQLSIPVIVYISL